MLFQEPSLTQATSVTFDPLTMEWSKQMLALSTGVISEIYKKKTLPLWSVTKTIKGGNSK